MRPVLDASNRKRRILAGRIFLLARDFIAKSFREAEVNNKRQIGRPAQKIISLLLHLLTLNIVVSNDFEKRFPH